METQYTVGIDIGGTNTVVACVDRDGKIVCRASFKTQPHATSGEFIRHLGETVNEVCRGFQPKGIGVGAPCANPGTGCIDHAAELPWDEEIPVAAELSRLTGVPVSMVNDAKAAALGEMAYGAARGMNNFVMITLGTGVGGGVVADGHLIQGTQGYAAELGHVIVRPGGRDCSCGRKGCLQTYCNARGVVLNALEALEQTPSVSTLREIPADKMTAKDIGEAAAKGDSSAIHALAMTGRYLGEAAANYAACFDPEAFILFGGVANAGDFILEPMREAMEENLLFLYKGKVRVLHSTLPQGDAALLGAAAAFV